MTLKKPLGIFLAFCLFTGSAFGAAFQFGGLRLDKLTVTSSSSTVVLTKAHKQVNISQGSSNQVYNLPDATTLQAGYFYTFINESSGTLTINNSSSTVITTLAGTSTGAADALSATLYVTSTATTGGPWSVSKGGSSGSGTGSSLTKSYNITSHGFAVNDVVYCTATTTCAKATAAANNDAADPIGIVTAADANNFTVTYAGYASTLTGKTANTVYALSNTTAGLLVVDGSETCTTGTVHRVMLKTDSTTSGWVSNAPGTVCTGAVTPTTTSWATYTPTLSAGFGTATGISFYWRRVGDLVQVRGDFSTGTVAGSLGTISLPGGYTIDTTKIKNTTSGNPSPVIGKIMTTTANQFNHMVASVSTDATLVYAGGAINVTGNFTPNNVNNILPSSTFTQVEFEFPISGN